VIDVVAVTCARLFRRQGRPLQYGKQTVVVIFA
jgi:hypothetical protein